MVPATISIILTNILTRKEYGIKLREAEVRIENMQTENKNKESDNHKLMYESYNLVLTQNKLEIKDVNDRFTNYIKQTNERENYLLSKISKLEKSLKELHEIKKDNELLKEKVRILSDDICEVKGITREELFKDIGNVFFSNDENDNEDI